MKQKVKILVTFMGLALVVTLGVAMATSVSAQTTTDGFVYEVNSDGTTVTVTGYTGAATEIIIPSTINGKTVTGIGTLAFSTGDEYDLITTKITIPDTVKHIGIWAFCGCTSLASITIPRGVTHIGHSLFTACRGLTSIVIPDSVTSIDDWAFGGCDGLTSIVIPDSVTRLELSGCSSLTSIVIPDSVIDLDMSGCSSLTELILPDSLTTIGEWAFTNCSALERIEFITQNPVRMRPVKVRILVHRFRFKP